MSYKIQLGKAVFHYDSIDHFNIFEKEVENFVEFNNEEEEVAIIFSDVKNGEIKGLSKEKTKNYNYVKIKNFNRDGEDSYWYITDIEYDQNLSNPVLKIKLDVLSTHKKEIKNSLENKLLKIERAHLKRYDINLDKQFEDYKASTQILSAKLANSFSILNIQFLLKDKLSDKVSEILRVQEFETKTEFKNYYSEILLKSGEEETENGSDIFDYHLSIISLNNKTVKWLNATANEDIDNIFSRIKNNLTNTEESSSFDGALLPLNLNILNIDAKTAPKKTWILQIGSGPSWIRKGWTNTSLGTRNRLNTLRFNSEAEARAFNFRDIFGIYYSVGSGNLNLVEYEDITITFGDFQKVNYINNYRAQNEILSIYHTPFKKPIDPYSLVPISTGSTAFVFGEIEEEENKINLILKNDDNLFEFRQNFIFGLDVASEGQFLRGDLTKETTINKLKKWEYLRELAIYNNDNFLLSLEINGIKQKEEIDFTNYIRNQKTIQLNFKGYYTLNSNEGYFNVIIENTQNDNQRYLKNFRLNKLPINSDSWATYLRQQGASIQEADYQAEKNYKITKTQAGLGIFSGIAAIAGGVGIGGAAGAGGIGKSIGVTSIAGGINQIGTSTATLQTADFEKRKIAATKKDLKNQFSTTINTDNYNNSLVGSGRQARGLKFNIEREDKEVLKLTARYYHKFGYQLEKIDHFNFVTYLNRYHFNFIQITETNSYLNFFNNEIRTEIVGIFERGVRLWNNKESFLNYSLENWDKQNYQNIIERLENEL